jgi:uncharacterized membrane protein YesL
MGFLNIDSPFMQTLNRIADIMLLNILTLLCCLPIITIGPALTALHYMCLKMVRNEECYIVKGYFNAFKVNFKKSFILWILLILISSVLVGDYYIMRTGQFHMAFRMTITVASALIVFMAVFLFPVQAKFENTVFKTIKNAFIISVIQFPKTILMLVLYVAPIALFIFFPQTTPFIFLFGISVPVYLSAMLYNKFFKKLEDQILGEIAEKKRLENGEEPEEEDERIFRDESDSLLTADYKN